MTVREDGEAQLCRQVEADTPGFVQDHDHPSLTVFHGPAVTGVLSGRRAMLVMAAGVAIALCAVVIAGIMLADAASTTNFDTRNLAPSLGHPFGTDWMGRDMLARTLAGLSTSVVVGLVAATVSSVIALALASAAALGGSRVDAVVSWLIDLTMGIPHMVLLILISYALGRGTLGVMVGISVTHWPSLARVLRAEILQLRQYLVGLVLLFPHAVLHEASITFLGFGLSPEQPAIGVILSEAMGYLTSGAWWLAVFPGLALLAVVLMFDRAGALLRRMMSPEGVQG